MILQVTARQGRKIKFLEVLANVRFLVVNFFFSCFFQMKAHMDFNVTSQSCLADPCSSLLPDIGAQCFAAVNGRRAGYSPHHRPLPDPSGSSLDSDALWAYLLSSAWHRLGWLELDLDRGKKSSSWGLAFWLRGAHASMWTVPGKKSNSN